MTANERPPCPHCGADLNGASIWETGYRLAMTTGGDTWPTVPTSDPKEAEERADRYAELYGATRTSGRFGRAIGIYDLNRDRTAAYRCPDCGKEWPR